MKIEIKDSVAAQCGLDEKQALELLAVALYRYKNISSELACELIGKSELEFQALQAMVHDGDHAEDEALEMA